MMDLADVQGDSGTSVTLYLQPAHFSPTHPSLLLPMLTKLLETTRCMFAFKGVIPQEEEEASQRERKTDAERTTTEDPKRSAERSGLLSRRI
jgi:hypothetical protein